MLHHHHHHHHHHHRSHRRVIHVPPVHRTEVVNIPLNRALQARTKNDAATRSRLQVTNAHGRKHALTSLKSQYRASEAAFRAATPRVLAKLNIELARLHKGYEQAALRHRTERITHEAGIHYKNLMQRIKIARARLARAQRGRVAWRRRAKTMSKNRSQQRIAHTAVHLTEMAKSQSADLMLSEFDRELSSVHDSAKRLFAYKRQLVARAHRESAAMERKSNRAYMKRQGYNSDGSYVAHFQPEADGSPADTRPLQLGKKIDPSEHGRGLIEDDFASDFGSINRATHTNEEAIADHVAAREAAAGTLASATYDVSKSKVAANVGPASLLEMSRHHHHHHHHHHHRHRSLPPIYIRSPPIIHRVTNNPNPAIQRAAATAARTFTNSDRRLDADYHRARADLLRVHKRIMARLRADRDRQIARLRDKWRKTVLKYDHHPKPSKRSYSTARMRRLRKTLHHINKHAAGLEHSIATLKKRHAKLTTSFDSSRVRNGQDALEEDRKVDLLLKKLRVNRRKSRSVAKLLDHFD